MSKKLSGDQTLVRVTNQNLIIQAIRNQESTTRRDLSKLLKLSVPSVCSNVDQLLEKEILIESSGEGSGVGRKASVLRLNPHYGYLITIDLSNPCISVVLSKIIPEIVQVVKFDIEKNQLEKLPELLLINIDKLLKVSGIDVDKLLAISVSIPGNVDSVSGIVQCGSYLKSLQTLDIKGWIQKKFTVPVYVHNDINAAVVGELNYGVAVGRQNVIFVSVDVGLGVGIVLGGRLYAGSSNNAGDIDRFVMNLDSLYRSNTDKVQLQDLVSIGALLSAIKSDLSSNMSMSSDLLTMSNGDVNQVDFNMVIKAAQAGDVLCLDHIRRSARIMAVAVANMMNLLDLEQVILGGGFVTIGEAYTETLKNEVMRLISMNSMIVNTSLGSKAVIMGGIAIALEHIFNELVD
ncbi:ROK family protein [Paenibacillus sp. CMAA1364]